ncbi:hypothetical protein [Streptomyces fildesensis]|uniref:hypothetical protein n=1 Tax=Streptomyces fildesensis TaxID=375757 RepID=UPI0018DF567C|nr:hypothetical protein [Streptomyces fildesensis]
MTGRGREWIKEGVLARDTSTNRVGEVRQIGSAFPSAAEPGEFAWLRPEHGGVEWSVPLAALEPVDGDQ